MNGLNLESLAEYSKDIGMTQIDLRYLEGLFKDLEKEGKVFQAKDEVSGETLWFPIQEQGRKPND